MAKRAQEAESFERLSRVVHDFAELLAEHYKNEHDFRASLEELAEAAIASSIEFTPCEKAFRAKFGETHCAHAPKGSKWNDFKYAWDSALKEKDNRTFPHESRTPA